MNGPFRDSAIGAAVVLVVAAAIFYVFFGEGRNQLPGYDLTAEFRRIDGLTVGGEVRMAGVVVGQVAAADLSAGYRPLVRLRIQPGIEIPADSAALIHTDGLLGAKYVELQPGGDLDNLKPGDRFAYTQDAVVLQDLLETIVAEVKMRNGTPGTEEPAR
ncbi:MAG: outer membrane lipid asymmetry maintenance protein MlaD [Rhodospirillales bacterium]|nr:outer membrane lipid asymmetry maintenance protein MlaD [Rhodospirillales bacterium]